LRLVFSREWLESREVAHEEEVLEVETRGRRASSSTGNYCWGEPVTHPRSHREK
jgi:hypothetical protein